MLLKKWIFCSICVTVIMGSRGPKISSVMIADPSGGSSNIVGSINLHNMIILKSLKLCELYLSSLDKSI
jgi:ribosomal protein S27E